MYVLRIFIIYTYYNNRKAQNFSMELVGTWSLRHNGWSSYPALSKGRGRALMWPSYLSGCDPPIICEEVYIRFQEHRHYKQILYYVLYNRGIAGMSGRSRRLGGMNSLIT